MSRYCSNIISICQLHHILSTILFSLFIYMFQTIFDSISYFVDTLNTIYSKCILLCPNFNSYNLDISNFTYDSSVCKSCSFICCLTFLIIFDMCLICNRLSNWCRLEFHSNHFRFLFSNLFLTCLNFSCTVIVRFNINFFNFSFKFSNFFLKFNNFLKIIKIFSTYYFYWSLVFIIVVCFYSCIFYLSNIYNLLS